MGSSQFIRWSGAAALVAGVLGIANAISGGVTWIYYLGQLATLITFTGILLFQRESSGVFGLIGFLMAAIGLLTQSFGIIPGLSDMVYALGVIILAIASLRAASFPRWVPLLWVAGPVFGILGFALPAYESALFLSASILFGVGLIGAGITLWRSPARLEST